jgi:hypothetical protein
MFGCLCLGAKESLKFSPDEVCFEALDARRNKIYRKTQRNCAACTTVPKRCELART